MTHPTRRDLLALLSGTAALAAQPRPSRPNILLLFTDQQTHFALSAHGNPYLKTPAMDSLAARGVSFEHSYTPYPLCSPARSTWWTGRMPHETGVRHNGKRIREGMPMMGDVFRAAGYDTVYGGKWHLGKQPEGFRAIAGHTNLGSEMDAPLAAACEQFFAAPPKQPFLLAASFLNPHDICQWIRDHPGTHGDSHTPEYPPAPGNLAADPEEPEYMQFHRTSGYNSMSEGVIIASEWRADDFRRYRNAYYRMVEDVDKQIGRVLAALERSGLAGNTLVMLTSDHGDGLGAHRWVQKVAFYEESAKVPLIFAGAGVERRGVIDRRTLVSSIDILPTVCAAAGVRVPAGVTGHDLCGVLAGEELLRSYVVSELSEYGKPDRQGRMLRTDRYKYVVFNGGARPEQLFDLQFDPGEVRNLARLPEAASILSEHRAHLRRWIADTRDDFIFPKV